MPAAPSESQEGGEALPRESPMPGAGGDAPSVRHVRAWLLLVAALALHVIDEAMTGFLDFYNPLVLRIRLRMSWFPMPTFSFGEWLAGLVLLVLVLAGLAAAVRRGGRAAWLLSWLLSVIMFMNGLGHLAGSVYFQRWLPGATSAPLLLASSLLLARVTRQRHCSTVTRAPHAVQPAAPAGERPAR
jgi:hypothetical protein